MGFISKLKLLFTIQKPFGQATDAVIESKKTRRWWHLTATLIGIAITCYADYAGLLPPQYAIIVKCALIGLYALARGADNAESHDIKGYFRSSEFKVLLLGSAQTFFQDVKASGIDASWVGAGMAVLTILTSSGQNLSSRAPDPTGESKGLETKQE